LALDKNGDGSITLDELKIGLSHMENSETLLSMLQAADTDGSGAIDYTEFLAATMDQRIFMRDDYLRTVFEMFDKDGSGNISKDELTQVLQGDDMKNLISKDMLDSYINEIDKDGDGEISFSEFQDMMAACT